MFYLQFSRTDPYYDVVFVNSFSKLSPLYIEVIKPTALGVKVPSDDLRRNRSPTEAVSLITKLQLRRRN